MGNWDLLIFSAGNFMSFITGNGILLMLVGMGKTF